jgi:hypothetical protein
MPLNKYKTMTNRISNLTGSPFAFYSAEEELQFLDEIYYEPKYYNELKELLSSGVSRFILGQRGQGKSATIYKLFNDLSKNHTLPLLIARYDDIPLTQNENHILYSIMQTMTMGIANHLFENPKSRKKLTKLQQQRVSFFIELFYDEHCSSQFIESAKVIRNKKLNNRIRRFFNKKLLNTLNTVINGTVHITTSYLKQNTGLETGNESNIFKEYLKALPEKPINSYSIDEVAKWDRSKLLGMLNVLIECSKTLEFDSIVILFDKIDEFQKINGDVDKVTDFTIEILSDTDLLYSDKLSIVFSLWSEVKRSLNKRGIRFDKFKDVDTRWKTSELEPLINKRLKHFSKDKLSPVTLKILMPREEDRKTALELADHSPRSLIRLMGEIYNEDYQQKNLTAFTNDAISNGFISFCKGFDYESQTPSKQGKGNDLVNWINRLLRLRKTQFSIEDLNAAFTQKSNISIKHIETMVKLGLIKENYMKTPQGDNMYEIVDPKIKFLIKRQILDLGQ